MAHGGTILRFIMKSSLLYLKRSERDVLCSQAKKDSKLRDVLALSVMAGDGSRKNQVCGHKSNF